jgi:hypothetical protein
VLYQTLKQQQQQKQWQTQCSAHAILYMKHKPLPKCSQQHTIFTDYHAVRRLSLRKSTHGKVTMLAIAASCTIHKKPHDKNSFPIIAGSKEPSNGSYDQGISTVNNSQLQLWEHLTRKMQPWQ